MSEHKADETDIIEHLQMINSNTWTKIKIQRNAFDEYALKSCDNAFATLMGIFYYIKIPF